jgi:group II intron reverse transcriptase/maturase
MAINSKKVNWILDADIQGFFDSISHEWMFRFLEYRISDRMMLRLIRKWLKAGVSEDGEWSSTEVGTPQGAPISPLLANVFLHYALDQWVEKWRKVRAKGGVYFVRYADDFVIGFQYKADAARFLFALRERLEKFGLKLHPEKTRLIEFGRFAAGDRKKRGEGKPETFDFLGFTHICSKTRLTKKFKLLRVTIKKRMRAKLQDLKGELWKMINLPIKVVGKWLKSAVLGYFRYFAVPDNTKTLSTFRYLLCRIWLRILRRRGQKGRLTWEEFNKECATWIPLPTPMHPYPDKRSLRHNP